MLDLFKAFFNSASYNMKIIFGGKFFWFLLTSFLLYAYLMFSTLWAGEMPNEEMAYGHLFFPALLLVFYPAAFGIQNDADTRILEILFGIPNYMYKVWFARLILIYIEVFLVLVLYGVATYLLVYPVGILEMACQLMFPVLFVGNLAFLFSTLTRNGNATAILIIIIGILIIFLKESFFNETMWDISLNPYSIPENIHPVIWENTVLENRIFLAVGFIVWAMLGLLNLQKREKFV
jgi:hypothetical protein